MKSFRPLEVVHVDLAGGLEGLLEHRPAADHDIYAVLWQEGVPLGHLELTQSQFDRPVALAQMVAEAVAMGVGDRLFENGFEAAPRGMWSSPDRLDLSVEEILSHDRPLARLRGDLRSSRSDAVEVDVSVVVCTRNRPEQLARCLRSLMAVSPSAREVIVVDNDPDANRARRVVGMFPDVTYVAEPQPGLSRARNRGLREATGSIVAFTDDDTLVHHNWVAALAFAFDAQEIMCVTGLVLPAELATSAQWIFEKEMGGFSQGYRRISFDEAFFRRSKAHGVPVWQVGAGANMAIRRAAFALVGEFDERLGAGAAGCSEDSELWYRLLAEGWRCRYEPSAVVFHYHRDDIPALKRQARAYIRGHVAALFVQYARYGHRGNLHRALLAMPIWLLRLSLRDWWLRGDRGAVTRSYIEGYVQGLKYLPLAARAGMFTTPVSTGGGCKVSRANFLRLNPYPHPLSEGLFYREKMRAIHRIAPCGSFPRILEIGGGQSGLSADLYRGAEVISVDLEPSYAGSSMNARIGTRFLCADATNMPFSDNSFDLVTVFDVLEHVPHDEQAATEAIRVLRPGGVLLVTSPNEHWRFPYYRLLKPLCPTDGQIMAVWGHVRRGYSLARLEKMFGVAPTRVANYITPVTAVGHDLAFSRLPDRARFLACAAFSPLTWIGYWLHRSGSYGMERGSSWRPKSA